MEVFQVLLYVYLHAIYNRLDISSKQMAHLHASLMFTIVLD